MDLSCNIQAFRLTTEVAPPDLIATSGGDGDNQILLWNVRSGELATDLNASYRFVSVVLSFVIKFDTTVDFPITY